MTRTRVKICGLTQGRDVSAAVMAGADALGFVFAPKSRRKLDVETARYLTGEVPAFVSRVGLFQNQEAGEVRRVLDAVPLDLLQFHGDENAAYCGQFGLPYIKAVSMQVPDALGAAERAFVDAVGLLLDSHHPGAPGGTGSAFDWSLVGASKMPLILAGGLTPENAFEAVRQCRPFAVDVSSGVETTPGVKHHSRIVEFVGEVNRADRTTS